MRVFSFASGSSGNVYCVEAQDQLLLVDCGISCAQVVKRCALAGLCVEKIKGILFTHNHGDHIGGLKVFHKKYPKVELFANLMTAEAIANQTGIPENDFLPFENGQSFSHGVFTIHPFSIPHDVPDPVGYKIMADGETYFHATDVGTPLNSIGLHLADATIAILESNHDPVLLQQSDRAESLKQRIRGPRGHLTNDDAAFLLSKFAKPHLKKIGLAHLSHECNAPHLAERAVRDVLKKMHREDIELTILSQENVQEL